jgi:predicted AlkP superfamily phosphohydrolase/phosphomutase
MLPLKEVLAIGLDGFEPKIVELLLATGELPAPARLGEQGSFRRVQTTCPAETPVAWSRFATGTNSGLYLNQKGREE